jgi:parallel beta-helix repeat protein
MRWPAALTATSRVAALLAGAAVAFTFSSCGEREASGLLEPRLAAGPSRGFEIVFVTTHAPQASQAVAPRVTSLAEGVQLVRAGGTILVEDGEWETDGVVVNKPLTMASAPQAVPLLVNHNPDGTGLTIDGVAEGTVELRGLRFQNAAGLSAVLARGTYDRVVIRDSRVEVTAAPAGTGTALGINATTSTVPEGQLIVEKTTFVGGRFGVIAQGTTAHVRGSRFTEGSVASVQYTLGSHGTIENNEIDGCGSNACITVFDPAGIEIAGNTIHHPVGTARAGILALTTNPGSYSVSIRDNELVGTGVQPDDADPYGGSPFGRPVSASGLSHGIWVTGSATATVEGNRVSGAHWGIIFETGGSGRIIGNRVWDCGGVCITASRPTALTVIEDNLVSGDVGFRRAGSGIFAWRQQPDAAITIHHNSVTGNRNAGDPADGLSYAFRNGIQVISWNPYSAEPGSMVTGDVVEVNGNSVTDVGIGFLAYFGGAISAHDNVLTGMAQGFVAGDELSAMQVNRNDVLDAVRSVDGAGVIDARCNWWGSAGGPGPAGVPAGVYTPWATEPIANRPAVQCP